MIRSVVVPHRIEDEAEFAKLKAALEELGFEQGEGWTDERGTGAPYETGLGAIELFRGQRPIAADVLIEVTSVHRALEVGTKHGLSCSGLDETHWDATYFTVPIGDRKVAFFQFNDPAKAA